MAKGHRSQIKRERNENQKDTRPSAKLSYARISVQKACYVLDAIRGKRKQVISKTSDGTITQIVLQHPSKLHAAPPFSCPSILPSRRCTISSASRFISSLS